VSEPQGHFADILCRVQHDHRGGVPQNVRGHLLVQQLRAPLTGRFGVLFEQVGKSPMAQWFAANINEHLRDRDLPRAASHARNAVAVVFHKGSARSRRPLP
jgi:hypothetical protein